MSKGWVHPSMIITELSKVVVGYNFFLFPLFWVCCQRLAKCLSIFTNIHGILKNTCKGILIVIWWWEWIESKIRFQLFLTFFFAFFLGGGAEREPFKSLASLQKEMVIVALKKGMDRKYGFNPTETKWFQPT